VINKYFARPFFWATSPFEEHHPVYMAKKTSLFFDVQAINRNYQLVKADFPGINSQLSSSRDIFDDAVINNLLHAYCYLNKRLHARSGERPVSPTIC
jgi:hypothetical protein